MSQRLLSLSLMAILFFPILAAGEREKQKDKHSAKFGDLHVTATKLEDTQSAPHKGDHHSVAVFLKVENVGKGVVCASFVATLRTSFGLEYHADWLPTYPKSPKISEMLPGESAEGSYEFNVKDGVQPLELVLKLWAPRGEQPRIRCGPKGKEPWRDVLVPTEVQLDIHDLPAPEKPPTPSSGPASPPPASGR